MPAVKIDFLRPNLEEIHKVITEPIAAPNIIELTIHSCILLVNWNCSVIKGKAPAITPISRPNKRPAIPAAIDTSLRIRLLFSSDSKFIVSVDMIKTFLFRFFLCLKN